LKISIFRGILKVPVKKFDMKDLNPEGYKSEFLQVIKNIKKNLGREKSL